MILVTGATGTVGRQVVTQLSELGAPVRAVTRDPRSAGLPAGVEAVRADLADPAPLEPHLAGVDSAFLIWPFTAPGLAAGPGARLVEVLARHVSRIVYLSAEAAAGRPDSFWAAMERLIEASQAEQVGVIGDVVGRAVRWEELAPEEARRQLLAAWGDPAFVDSALTAWAGLVTHPEPVTGTVREITGTPARAFRRWAADHADDFRLA